jgi:sulfotransferase family protein
MEQRLARKARKVFQRNRKRFYHLIRSRVDQQSILFIVGCQRSGNSMMQDIFDKDLNTKCFHEFSQISSNDSIGGIRLNSLDLVKQEFSKFKAPLIVLKPLVESQNVPELLNFFDNGLALWMFRNYKDVASSNLKLLGVQNGINDLRPIVNHEPNNWRSEKVSEHVRKTILKYFSESMNPFDAAVLFWWARNSIFFDRELGQNPRVVMCSYEDFVLEPETFIRGIYRRLGQPFPTTNITANVHSKSRQKGKDIEISPQIEQLALEMQDQLEGAYRTQLLHA